MASMAGSKGGISIEMKKRLAEIRKKKTSTPNKNSTAEIKKLKS